MVAQFSVLLTRPEHEDPLVLAKALATVRKTPLQDQINSAKGAWGIVAESVPESEARDLASALRQSNVECSVVPASALCPLPEAKPLVRMEPDIARDLALIAAAGFTVTTTTTKTTKEGPTAAQKMLNTAIFLGTGLPIKMGGKERTVEKTQTQSDRVFYMDLLYKSSPRRLRVDALHFDYSFLKERKLYQVFGNFKSLVADLAQAAPQALRNHGTSVLLEGKPLQTLGYESLADLDREIRWLLTLQSQ